MSDAGYYLLQSGGHAGPDRISVVFDCGELGMGPLAAHGFQNFTTIQNDLPFETLKSNIFCLKKITFFRHIKTWQKNQKSK
jgi:hypothetical protein